MIHCGGESISVDEDNSAIGAPSVTTIRVTGAGFDVGVGVKTSEVSETSEVCVTVGAAQEAKRIVVRNRNINLLRMLFSINNDFIRPTQE
ncbi:MAG: hypothetical protein B6D38_08775 [Anaerolineae bacterium UTCFX1]|nr:MAG: hypothetical protein B6D38_08775 [Anaerolineae bacterium UTCFX1]